MDWKTIGLYAWHGLSQAVITGGASVAAVSAWPTKVQWLIIGAGMAVAFVKGVEGYIAAPAPKP